MSFKFKLGEWVVPKDAPHTERAKIEAFHLNGFMRIAGPGNTKYIVRDIDYATWTEEEVLHLDCSFDD